ncbi:MAG: FAD-dependent oxidoreductase, partial [Actinobacteria bacterium]
MGARADDRASLVTIPVTGRDRFSRISNVPVTVIGAGIVGLSCALALQRLGRNVTVIDRRRPGHGASFGHAGGIAVTWVSPQGLPGLAKHLPGWLLDPLGPVAVRWPYLPRLVPWFIRLRRHSRAEEIERIGDALAALMGHAWPAWDRTLAEIGLHRLVRHDGALTAYRERSRLDADRLAWDMRRRRGFEVEVIDGRELRRQEPALSAEYTVGVVEPQAKWCQDPMA